VEAARFREGYTMNKQSEVPVEVARSREGYIMSRKSEMPLEVRRESAATAMLSALQRT
jgi:hypothetical protein